MAKEHLQRNNGKGSGKTVRVAKQWQRQWQNIESCSSCTIAHTIVEKQQATRNLMLTIASAENSNQRGEPRSKLL
jgi:hypothetical protein